MGVFLQSVASTALADCDLTQCAYSVSLDKTGFYIPIVKLPATSKEGFWGLSLNTSSGLNEGGFNAGGVLGENANYPGFIGFYLTQAEKVNISAYEYTGGIKELTVSISDANKNFVLSPTAFKPNGETKDSAVLQPGFYAATVYSKSGDPRGQFGISLLGKSFGGGVNVGGWIDSVTGDGGKGFGGLYVSSPQTVNLQVLFGDSYGSVGAGRPNVEIYRQETTGVRVLQWSSADEDAKLMAQLQKLPGTWKFLATSYAENTINLTTVDSDNLTVSGTDGNGNPVYVKYNTSKEKFYLYVHNGWYYSPQFWFHFVSDNAVTGCLTWDENYDGADYDCSLGGTRN
jgi:hypothetical protein